MHQQHIGPIGHGGIIVPANLDIAQIGAFGLDVVDGQWQAAHPEDAHEFLVCIAPLHAASCQQTQAKK